MAASIFLAIHVLKKFKDFMCRGLRIFNFFRFGVERVGIFFFRGGGHVVGDEIQLMLCTCYGYHGYSISCKWVVNDIFWKAESFLRKKIFGTEKIKNT